MPTADAPPQPAPRPSAAVQAARPSAVPTVTQAEADRALQEVRGRIPHTQFVSAQPSRVPGLVVLRMEGGKVAYTDASGKFLILGLIFDIDTGAALDGQMDGVSGTPQ